MTGGVCIGVVAVGPPTWDLVGSIVKLRKPAAWTWRRVGPLAVDVGRNRLCREFLRSEDEWLLMVDADAVLHPMTLLRLLSWKQPVVSALAFSRYGPMFPTVYRGRPADGRPGYRIQYGDVKAWLQEHPELISSEPVVLPFGRQEECDRNALYQVDRTGCHCVLIHRSALEEVAQPWFRAKEDFENGAGEDFFFFERLEAAGIPVYVDLGCMAGHVYGDRVLAARDHLVWDYASTFGEQQED